jgi:hypothetical protein
MVGTRMAWPPPYTQALFRALQAAENTTTTADLLLLEAWEISRSMHLGIMLRIRQIRRANPQLAIEIAAELTDRRTTTRTKAA